MTATRTRLTPARRRRPARPADPGKAWARRLGRVRPDLIPFVLEQLATIYGHPTWERWHDPTSELVLTILSQNSADVNAEKAFEALRRAYPRSLPPALDRPVATAVGPAGPMASAPSLDRPGRSVAAGTSLDRPAHAVLDRPAEHAGARPGWGGAGLELAADPDWSAVETAPLPDLIDVIRPGGLAPQKAPRIQAALRAIRDQTGSHSLEFLGDMPAREARDWLTAIGGIGPKTASVVLLFSFGMPLMPVDRHVERVSKRIGLIPPKATADEAHDLYLAMLEPDQAYEAHVNLIQHGRRICVARAPRCAICPVAPRCRFVSPKAP